MTERNNPVTEDELHAYVDDELFATRRRVVRAWLASHPDDAERVCVWRALSAELHRCYDGIINEPVPQRLALEHLVARPRSGIWAAAAAAVLLAFILGGGAGWVVHEACAAEVSSTEGVAP